MQAIVDGRYELVRPIGDGRMSSVFHALDLRRFRNQVVIKILDTSHPDELRQEFFRRETQALERLNHLNIIQILDHGFWVEESRFYIVLERLDHSLADRLQGPPVELTIDPAQKFSVLAAIADALVYAHGEGVIHRDIKPSNILFDTTGTPKLSDFGISRLQFELATGLTVAGFWSAGYAAPEIRFGQPGDERSDLYSLGVVAHHYITGQPPSGDGPKPNDLDHHDMLPEVRTLLSRLLAAKPDDRPESAVEVQAAFQKLDSKTGTVPELFLCMTDEVRQKIYELNLISVPKMDDAIEWVIEELGGSELLPVPTTLENNGEIRLIGSQVRLTCRPTNDRMGLVLYDVHIPYSPDLQASRQSALPVRNLWQPVSFFDLDDIAWDERSNSRRTLNSMLDQLSTHNRTRQTQHSRRYERRNFIDTGERILNIRQQRIDEKQHPLGYVNVSAERNVFVFDLREPVPDNLPWVEGSPIAVVSGDRYRSLLQIGSLIEISGKQAKVAQELQQVFSEDKVNPRIPESGSICLFISEELSSLKRERTALRQLAGGDAKNPRLVEVLTDLRRSERDEAVDKLDIIQAEMDDDKRDAVRNALATRDLFLIQGPPGTGKTTVITEIILQLLKSNPQARILVTSQSNVPINHVLSKLASLAPNGTLEILRLGREEKIGQGAEIWQLEQRLESWRVDIVAYCSKIRGELIAQTRRRRRDRDRLTMPEEEFQQCHEWLYEASDKSQSLQEERDRLALFRRERDSTDTNIVVNSTDSLTDLELRALEDAVSSRVEDLEAHVAAIYELLPENQRGVMLPDVVTEIDRLMEIVSSLASQRTDDPIRARRQLVDDWIKVFGHTYDFKALLLQRANIIAATCLFAGGRLLQRDSYDWVIVDEAGRATATELFIPLVKARRAILVGDERQLPPMLDAEITQETLRQAGLSEDIIQKSLFETLVLDAQQNAPNTLCMLTVQYRMHPAIGQLISDVFYDGKLKHGANQSERNHGLNWLTRPVVWLSTSQLPDKYEVRRDTSFANTTEVDVIEDLLERMERDYNQDGLQKDIGIIAGYSGQVAELIGRLEPSNRERWRALAIEVATVDAFQGRDRDIVVYSTVRSNPEGRIGFLRDRRRINVALSRARELLVIVGDESMYRVASTGLEGNPFRSIIVYMEAHGDDCRIVDWKQDMKDWECQ